MDNQQDLRPTLRQQAGDIVGRLTASAREALLIKCWMSHDARWFMAVAREYGAGVANRLNQVAAHEIGKVEAPRIARALQLPSAKTIDEYLLAQEIFISLLGPDLLDYGVSRVDENTCRMHVRRCFAHEHAVRAGIADEYECGVFPRVTGWLEALGLAHEIHPALGKCLKAQGQECVYTIGLRAPTQGAAGA